MLAEKASSWVTIGRRTREAPSADAFSCQPIMTEASIMTESNSDDSLEQRLSALRAKIAATGELTDARQLVVVEPSGDIAIAPSDLAESERSKAMAISAMASLFVDSGPVRISMEGASGTVQALSMVSGRVVVDVRSRAADWVEFEQLVEQAIMRMSEGDRQ